MNVREPAVTLAGSATVPGVGLFTGAPVTLRFVPAPPGHGVHFRRTDLAGPPIPALVRHVFADPRLPGRCTCLIADPLRAPTPDNPSVYTVEHVLSALVGLGVSDAVIELDGPEAPIGDGSALGFVDAILGAGLVRVPDLGPRPLVVDRLVAMPDPRTPLGHPAPHVVVRPCEGAASRYEYILDYRRTGPLGRTTATWDLDPGTYVREVAPARTFCLAEEAAALRQAGLFKDLTPRDMLVFGSDDRPIDQELRFPDEPARHKLLDLVGDLALIGRPLRALVDAERSGHVLHHLTAKAVVDVLGVR